MSELHGAHPFPAVRRLRDERDNFLKAWHWALENERVDMLAAALPAPTRIFHLAGLLHEGAALMQRTRKSVSQLPLALDLPLAEIHFSLRVGEYDTARDLLETLPPLEDLSPGQPHLALESLAGLAYVRWQVRDKKGARVHIERFLDLLDQASIEGFASPGLSYRRAAEVLEALGEEEKAEAMVKKVQQFQTG